MQRTIAGETSTGVQVPVKVDATGQLFIAGTTPGTGATDLGKAEDAGHTSGDTGIMLLAVRKDTAAALAGTDLDYIPLTTDSTGRLWVAPLQAGEAHIGEVAGNLTMISTEFTRPADTTAYAANDTVADSTSAPTMQALANAARVSGGSGYITGVRVNTDKKSITPRIRVHLYNTNGATISNDNAAWQDRYADNGKYVGYVDLPAMITGADSGNSTNSYSQDLTVRIPYTCVATSLYYVLETLDVFTPASGEKFTVSVFLDRN